MVYVYALLNPYTLLVVLLEAPW